MGMPNSGPRVVKFSRRGTGRGVVPNSSPKAMVSPFQGTASIALFSSHMATQGKSIRRKQYASRSPSLWLTAATKPSSIRGSTSTPTSFPSSQSSGFFFDLLGRLGPFYLAQILYDNVNVRGGDNPLVSYAQGRVAFEPPSSHAAFGLGYVSIQRSTSNANMNAFGVGLSLLPDLRGGLTPYASVYVYPHVQHNGVGATFTSADVGLLFAPRKRGGLFFSLGGSLRSGLPAHTSPSSFTGLRAGIGTAF